MCYSSKVGAKYALFQKLLKHNSQKKKSHSTQAWLSPSLSPPTFSFHFKRGQRDRGDRWRELLTLLPVLPPSTSPLPWCLLLNYISTLASSATLFTHSFIHIHLACTCLVPVRVARRERTHKACTTLHTNTAWAHTYAQALLLRHERTEEQWRCQWEKAGWWGKKMKTLGKK